MAQSLGQSHTVTGSTTRDCILFAVLVVSIAMSSWRLRVYFEVREQAPRTSVIETR